METTARAGRASLIGCYRGENAWTRRLSLHPILGRVSDRGSSGGRAARGDKSFS